LLTASGCAIDRGDILNVVYQIEIEIVIELVAKSAPIKFTYDAFEQPQQEVSPDRGTSTYVFSPAGLPVSRTDARGVTASFAFDALNRLTNVSYSGGPTPNSLVALWLQSLGSSILSDNVTFTYDQGTGCTLGIGRLCSRQDQSGTERFGYDAFGNIIQQANTQLGFTYSTGYTYDSGNRLTQMTYPDGRVVSYARDALDRVSGIQATVNQVSSPIASAFQYRADSSLVGMTVGNGIVETRGYDPVGRLVSQLVGTVDTRAYTYNAVGDMTAKQTSVEVDQFTYDALDRLTGEGRTQGSTTHSNGFGYDPNDNRLTEVRDGALTSFGYTPGSNRLIQVGSAALTLDSAGNTTADLGGTRKFNYSAANHLQWISQNGVPIAGYLYNGLGQRTGKLTLQGISLYHYDVFGHLISETSIGSQPSRDYVWAGSAPIAQIDHWVPIGSMLQKAHCSIGADGKIDWISYLHTDGLGTPRVATDVSQNVVWRDDGEAFGETSPTQTVPAGAYPVIVNLRNPGQYLDQETGLFYNRARYYNPQSGRYLTSDPIGLGGGLNTYSYADGNPFLHADPLGLDPQAACDRFTGIGNAICSVCVKTFCTISPAATACCAISKDECIGNSGGDPTKMAQCVTQYGQCITKGPPKGPPKPPEDI
jgi:RHS repeat-associated protein